ncbi:MULTISPECIES: M23 family metallopeptidase [Glutamicibacter]|uniref:M23 family peptidase n=1 Tax=Glutamicibacter arilaitensis (strain DSM 16368 / CIP 108037 / IAM 15318 / JCM 13566 / NCIMB 14258 / Re117) TaxID=861360 RepID=A0ABM9PUE7_GLUAR|nr:MULTISPECIES: M23 family metallopeptidase [Glutamicibacter]CBT74790.1 putative M23 family peptidase [Glutamicibacter arilaitensis Re117]HCH49020.1 M23 family peptidase [Glutamicibacter sp.]HCJ53586.1 M23 family peptidase [Glutamicibacter sp.]HCM95746.1 M23 family peptidase [Glutamicibacter sp.]
MVETKTAGRRRVADVEVDVIAEVTASATERTGGRRAARAAATVPMIAPAKPVHEDFVGRRFDSVHRYGVAPTQSMLAATDVASNVVLLPNAAPASASKPKPVEAAGNVAFIASFKSKVQKTAHRGFAHKVAAVAAVSGLALAAVTPQLSGNSEEQKAVEVAAQRTATSAVVDVTAPSSNAELSVERAALSSELNTEVAKEEKFAEVMTASGGSITAIKDTSGLLGSPVTTQRITSSFGHRKNPTGAGYMIHSGTDYGVPSGTKVYAAADGIVTVSGWAGHSGNRITLDHGNGLETGYSHNSKLVVKVGQKVKRGDVVALAGSTGNSTGPHVHFEVIVDGQFKDPAGWL